MPKIKVTTDLQSMLIDFGDYGSSSYPANGSPTPMTAAFDKDYVKTFEKVMMPSGNGAIRVNTNDSKQYYLTHDQANIDSTLLVVDSVEGIAPTTLDMLLNLLSQTKYITYESYNISTANTFVIKSGWGVLHAINVTGAVVSTTIKVYDGTATAGKLIAEIPFGLSLLQGQISMLLDVRFYTSLTVVTTALSGASKVQISYK
jgi:hypothetical protein